VRAGELLAVDQPRVAQVLSGRLDGFSTERLLRFFTSLVRDVEIREKPGQTRRCGRLHVVARYTPCRVHRD